MPATGLFTTFGIAVAMEVPIKDHITRVVRGADVEHRPLVFWQSTWPDCHKYISVCCPEQFNTLGDALMQDCEDQELAKELAELVRHMSGEVAVAHRKYLDAQAPPMVH